MIYEYDIKDFDELLIVLKENAKRVIIGNEAKNISGYITNQYFNPFRAIIFPINKEIHSLVSFSDMLNFQIIHYLDVVQSGKVNRKLKNVVEYISAANIGENKIENIANVLWNENFDTVIVGHVNTLNRLLKKDVLLEVLEKCIQYKKNIISFADLTKYESEIKKILSQGNKVYFPSIKYLPMPDVSSGKMYMLSQPVVCVAGTSSSQGKFTFQLELRREFMLRGYQVGQLATEPSGKLFGIDEVFHYGYEVKNNDYSNVTIMRVNALMKEISKKQPDIIIAGLQSATVPYAYNNLDFLTYKQFEMMFGILPDLVVLCVNPFDEIAYIKRTILAIENYANTKVICCVLYPKTFDDKLSVFGERKLLEEYEQREKVSQLEQEVRKATDFNSLRINRRTALVNSYSKASME